jgi:hypothetical protein
VAEKVIGSHRNNFDYLGKLPLEVRESILAQLTEADLATPTHLMGIGAPA